jgi:hypothetical protein
MSIDYFCLVLFNFLTEFQFKREETAENLDVKLNDGEKSLKIAEIY